MGWVRFFHMDQNHYLKTIETTLLKLFFGGASPPEIFSNKLYISAAVSPPPQKKSVVKLANADGFFLCVCVCVFVYVHKKYFYEVKGIIVCFK